MGPGLVAGVFDRLVDGLVMVASLLSDDLDRFVAASLVDIRSARVDVRDEGPVKTAVDARSEALR